MASKRVAVKSIDWAKIAERITEVDRPKFLAFRAKSDVYLRRMLAHPDSAPKIDWAYYKKVVPIPGMADSFQQKYEAMQIPFPEDTATPLVEAQEREAKKEIDSFKAQSKQRIKSCQDELARLASLIPYDQMTVEDYYEAHPEDAFNPEKPTFWPHNPEEQLDYKPANPTPSAGH